MRSNRTQGQRLPQFHFQTGRPIAPKGMPNTVVVRSQTWTVPMAARVGHGEGQVRVPEPVCWNNMMVGGVFKGWRSEIYSGEL